MRSMSLGVMATVPRLSGPDETTAITRDSKNASFGSLKYPEDWHFMRMSSIAPLRRTSNNLAQSAKRESLSSAGLTSLASRTVTNPNCSPWEGGAKHHG